MSSWSSNIVFKPGTAHENDEGARGRHEDHPDLDLEQASSLRKGSDNRKKDEASIQAKHASQPVRNHENDRRDGRRHPAGARQDPSSTESQYLSGRGGQQDESQNAPATAAQSNRYTNEPHPALETPLLYFLLKRHPKMLKAMQGFYDMRWDIAYPLQSRIPCSNYLRRIGIILTWGELFLLLPFFVLLVLGIVYSFVNPNVSNSGQACRTPLIFAFVTATRNNILTFFLGLPVERAIKYHKVAAKIAYFSGWLHTISAFLYPVTENSDKHFFYFLFQDSINVAGTMLILFLSFMIITALPWIRRKLFELFYHVHVVLAVVVMICAFYHSGIVVPILGGLTWGFDVLVRKVYMPFFRYPRKAKVQVISDTVIELSFPKQLGFDYNPGQYIHIAVPKLGLLEWHPFSLSSSPKQKRVTLHIRAGGDWTRSLYDLAKQQDEIEILMEGPYGSVGVDFTNPYKYETVILFSGGIGVTPMQSLCNSLMYEHSKGIRKLRKVSFIWIERDPVVLEEVDAVRHTRKRTQNNIDLDAIRNPSSGSIDEEDTGEVSIATRLLAMVPPGRDTDEELTQSYPSAPFRSPHVPMENNPPRVTEPVAFHQNMPRPYHFDAANRQVSWYPRGDDATVDEDTFFQHAFPKEETPEESPLDLQVYLTNKDISDSGQSRLPPFVTIGRPDIQEIFERARQDALGNHQPRVAICVCAPLRIVNLCREACAKHSDRYVAFDFHYEVFE